MLLTIHSISPNFSSASNESQDHQNRMANVNQQQRQNMLMQKVAAVVVRAWPHHKHSQTNKPNAYRQYYMRHATIRELFPPTKAKLKHRKINPIVSAILLARLNHGAARAPLHLIKYTFRNSVIPMISLSRSNRSSGTFNPKNVKRNKGATTISRSRKRCPNV